MLTCCTVTHKLLGVRSELREDLVGEFVEAEFGAAHRRVNVSEMKRWVGETEAVGKFLAIVADDTDRMFRYEDGVGKSARTLFSGKVYRSFRTSIRNELGSALTQASKALNAKKYQEK